MTPRRQDRPFDRTVKIRPGEKVLLVDGDDELFLEQTANGIVISDARGEQTQVVPAARVRGAGTDGVMIPSRSRA